MKDYLKKHETQAAYTTWTASENYVTPNVSLIDETGVIEYNPYVEPMNIITYEASAKLAETTTGYVSGLHTNAFNTTIKSHTFENGVGTVEFNDDVTSIGNNAFSWCSDLTSITIPNGVTSIGDGAFFGCSGLTSITIPDSVTSIVDSAFQNCSGLTSIVIDSGNTVYDSRDNCNGVIETSTNTLILGCKNTVIPNSVTSIGEGAFKDCSGLTSITIPNSVTSIGEYAFERCTGLTSITIPNSVTSIGNSAFYDCRSLTSVTIGSGVTSIGERAFYRCSGLTSIEIPNSVTSIGTYAFYQCTGLTSITIPSTVTSIGLEAFSDCSGLTSIVIDSGNTVYDSRDNCNGVIETSTNTLILGCKNTVIPNSVTSIGEGAFKDCSGLTSITIPNSVTSIGKGAFYVCINLTSITCNAATAPTIGNNTFYNVKTGGTLTVPTGSTGYDVWMGTGNFYLGKYSWTKVEQ